MTRLTYKEYLSIAVILAVVGVLGVLWQRPWQALGSIDFQGGGYYSTTTPVNSTNILTLRPGPGILGSVIITGSNGGNFYLYDATTSNVNFRTGNKASTTIIMANIPAGASSTTYTYDTVFNDGLLLVPSGTSIATSTITWK